MTFLQTSVSLAACKQPVDDEAISYYSVTFSNTGGAYVSSQSVDKGDKAAEPKNVTRTGYSFDGWYTDNNTFANKWDFNTAVTENITLYAKWIPVYTVTFSTNGGDTVPL